MARCTYNGVCVRVCAHVCGWVKANPSDTAHNRSKFYLAKKQNKKTLHIFLICFDVIFMDMGQQNLDTLE